MSVARYRVTFGLTLIFIIGVLFLMRPIIFPCLISITIAYLFNPVVVKFEQYRIPRVYSVILIVLGLLVIVVLTITRIVPIAYSHITSILEFLAEKIPSLKIQIVPYLLESLKVKIGVANKLDESYSDFLTFLVDALKLTSSSILQVLCSSFNFMHTISLVIITPIIFFYVLRDWPIIIEKAYNFIPIPYQKKVADYFSRVDFIIANYLKGQLNICVVMTIFYSVGLSILGSKHSIVIGILAGILTFIPCIGPLVYSAIGILSAITQSNNWFIISSVLLLFLIGQLLDSHILTPLLIGKKIQIHPVIIMLGVVMCISYFGFVGMLFFIPIVAVSTVSMEFIVDKYQKSDLYKNG